jgi:hypothetical protein
MIIFSLLAAVFTIAGFYFIHVGAWPLSVIMWVIAIAIVIATRPSKPRNEY